MNLGIDFGSTYSSFSTYNEITKMVELCRPGQSEPEAIPSIACLDYDDNILTGHSARNHIQTEDAGAQTFSAFKMLLAEINDVVLAERGYTGQHTPQKIADIFLKQQIRKILSDRGETEIENLVVCVPAMWTTQDSVKNGQLDGRAILRDICRNIPNVKKVNVISEPEAACAYFVYQYQKLTKKVYDGKVLIVDYGGGTLDLTLTEVGSYRENIGITVLHRAGLGENTLGQIGNAGIAYMEKVMSIAIAENRELRGKAVSYDAHFRKAVSSLEKKLMEQVCENFPDDENFAGQDSDADKKLFYAVDECGGDLTELEYNTDCFTKIRYCGKLVEITYAHLMKAYQEIIQPDLDNCLQEVSEVLAEKVKDYKSSNNQSLKIVLVGGFGKFILVQKQVQDFFGYSAAGDFRFQYGLGKDREYAVSMGAALLAADAITIRKTAPYGIGVYNDRGKFLGYAIDYGQEISAKKEYWISNEWGAIPFVNGENEITHLLIGFDDNKKKGMGLTLKSAMVKKIRQAYKALEAEYLQKFPGESVLGMAHNIGFRMDESEMVSLLIRSVSIKDTRCTGNTIRIELSDFRGMFGLAEIQYVGEWQQESEF